MNKAQYLVPRITQIPNDYDSLTTEELKRRVAAAEDEMERRRLKRRLRQIEEQLAKGDYGYGDYFFGNNRWGLSSVSQTMSNPEGLEHRRVSL